jgi:uncharacterized protein (DUF1800 family)
MTARVIGKLATTVAMAAAAGLLAACGGGGSLDSTPPPTSTAPTPPPTSTPPTTPPASAGPTAADAARFLDQATFGATATDVSHVQSVGFDAYIAEQLAASATQYSGFSYTPHTAPANCKNDPATPTDASSLCARDQYSPFQVQRQFFTNALNNPDQLRQRVAFALSQIFVISSDSVYEAYGMADYQNLLLRDAFSNYRQLLEDVTLSPGMGRYLDMVDNDKSNPTLGTAPNENYGREVLQLCSIGLYQLNADGSQQLDTTGAPIPTYDQNVVIGFSAVFTGWGYPPLAGATAAWNSTVNYDGVMVSFDNHHETGTKLLLNGVTVPTGQTAQQDLEMALDNIFNHANVGPFIGKQLIQHLVTSNPSPAYVARVAAVFADNGSGVRGDLSAVVKAILTDTEARGDAPASATFGHLREPALYLTAAMRQLGGTSDGVYLRSAVSAMGEPIYSSPSVFNFYPPSFVLPGTQQLAPEFGIQNAATALARVNFLNTVIMGTGATADPTVTGSIGTHIDLTPFASPPSASALIDQLNTLLMHGSLASDAATVIATAVGAQSSADPLAAARTAGYLIVSSPQYQVER